MTASKVIITALLAALGVSLPLLEVNAGARNGRPDTMPISAIKPGMKGYGLTVFEGTKPERFDVEVIGTLPNFRPHQDLILIKTKHPRLDVAKIVAGMSGSPIYIDGKMIGAYAYGWSFNEEPIAGVTPIADMIDDIERPLPKQLDGWPLTLRPGSSATSQLGHNSESPSGSRFAGLLKDYSLARHSEQMNRQWSGGLGARNPLQPVSTPLLMGGLTADAVDLANDLLQPMGLTPLQAGGGGATRADAPTRYVDGGAIGVQLIRGDMSAMGLGTVTRVEGDKLIGFGHPMMNSGVTNLPTAIGDVLWFLASKERSFKIGTAVRSVGALVNDRQASIVVSHSAQAPVVPVSLKIKGAIGGRHTDWHFDVAHEKFMTPTFLAIALGSGLQAVANERQDVSWNAVSKLKVKGFGEITLEDYGVAVGGTPEARDFVRSNLVYAVGALMNNPWRPVIIESASMEIELRYSRELLRLRGAEVLEREVKAGDEAHVRLSFVPFAGAPRDKIVTLPIPKHLAGETLRIEIQPGYMVKKPRPSPETLQELFDGFEDPTYAPKSVVLSYASGDALAFRGRIAEDLPPGVLDSLRPTTSTIAPEPYRSQTDQVVKLDDFVVGGDTVTLQVKPNLK